MANKDKIRLMTDLAMYRKKNEHIFQVSKYFGYDYIVWHLVLAAVRFTLCAVFVAALFVVFDAETVFYNVNLEGIRSTMLTFAEYYLIGLVLYLVIAYAVYHRKYNKARKGMLLYSSRLRRLARKYHYEEEDTGF